MMKFNFWQWLAIVLLIIGSAWWIYDWSHQPKVTVPPPTTLPTTQHFTAP